jgi:hypothetical protein
MLTIIKTQLLAEQNILPTKEVLKNALGESYLVFNELMEIITNNHFRLVKKCGHYNGGKYWLCKVCYKKKTICWLSVLNNFFKVGFCFTEKNGLGMAELDIENNIKEDFKRIKKNGKWRLLVVNMHRKEQIDDVIKIIEYKKGLK